METAAKAATTELIDLQRKLRCSKKKETRIIFVGPPGMMILLVFFF
jgi:hypothetical protein